MSEIDQVIQKIITEKTFSLEAVEAIKDMRGKLEAALGDVKRSEKSCDEYKQKFAEAQNAYTCSDKALMAYEAREKELVERERKQREIELHAEAERRVGDAYRDCFYAITKNTIIRESIQKEVVTPVEGQAGGEYTQPTSGYGQKDNVTETKETAKE